MPSKKNSTTKNGVDLDQVDVSSLTLVDKEDLLDDLSKKLKGSIRDAFVQATDMAKDELSDFLKENPTGSSASGSGGAPPNAGGGGGSRPPRPPRPPKSGDNDDFEKMRQEVVATQNLVKKTIAEQKKKDKEKRAKQLQGNVYSSAGVRHGEQIDQMASEIHTLNKSELEEAMKKASKLQESVKVSTLGKEQGILTDATVKLQQAIQQEIRTRSTTLGKIGEFMTKQNIDAVSIISGLAGHSPIVGLATKFILDKFRDAREQKAKEKAKKYQVGELHKRLPRPDEPQIDDNDIKASPETIKANIEKEKNEQVRHAALEHFHRKGHLTTDQHQDLHSEQIRPGFTPRWEGDSGTTSQAGATAVPPPLPSSPQQVAATPQKPPQQVLRDHMGNAVPDWEGYQKGTSKKQQQADEQEAWMNMMRGRGMSKMQQEWEESKKSPSPVPHWPELFGDEEHPKPTALAHLEKREAERVANPYNSPLKPMMVDAVQAAMPHLTDKEPTPIRGDQARVMPTFDMMKKAAAPIEMPHVEHKDPETVLHPEKLPNEEGSVTSLLKLMNGVQEDEDKKLSVLTGDKSGPFSKLEKLSTEQLEELKQINKHLAKQIEQADLDAAERRRETNDSGPDALDDTGGSKVKDEKKHGGIISTLMGGVETGLGRLFGGKIGKWLGLGEKEAKGAKGLAKGAEGVEGAEEGGLFSRWFGKAKGLVKGGAKGAGGAAEGAGEVGEQLNLFTKAGEGIGALGKGAEGAEVVGAGGILGKLGGFLKLGGRLGAFTKMIPILGWIITAITAIFDFIPAFLHAEKYLGDKKKLTMMDKVAAGLGGVVEGLFGIIDFVLGLFGVKTEIGKLLGKASAKTFASIFKAIGAIFNVLYQISKPIFMILGPILEFVAKRLGKALEIIGDFVEGFANFVEGLADIIGAFFSEDPAKALGEGLGKLKDGLIGMLGALGKWFLNMLGLDLIKDAFDGVVKSFTDMFGNLGDMIKKIPGYDTVMKAFKGIGDAFASVFDSIKGMVKNVIGEDNYKKLTDALQAVKDAIFGVLDWITDKLNALNPFHKDKPKPAPSPAPTTAPAPTPAVGYQTPERTGPHTVERSRLPERTTPAPFTPAPTTPTPVPAPTGTTTPAPSPTPGAGPNPNAPKPESEPGDAKVIPISGSVTSLFGNRANPFGSGGIEGHGAVDIAAPVGSPVKAVQDGTVVRANGTDDPNGYGNVIDIMHKDGYMSRYGHLSEFDVKKGDKVKKGDLIAKSGGAKGAPGSGRSSGPHLHFEVRKGGTKIDPQEFLGMTLEKGSKLDGGALAGNGPTPTAGDQKGTQVASTKGPGDQKGPGASQQAGAGAGANQPSMFQNVANGIKSFFGGSVEAAGVTVKKAGEVSMAKPRVEGDMAQIDPDQMAKYIAHMEGFDSKTDNWAKRNNNPGNLRPTSKDQKSAGGYRVFDTAEDGWKALHEQIEKTTAKGLNMREFFGGQRDENGNVIKGGYAGYAPSADHNDPNRYADYVAKNLGVDPSKMLALRPQLDTPKLTSDSPGMLLASASTKNVEMNRLLGQNNGTGSIINAPTTKVTNNNTTQTLDVRAKNTDTSYERNQNAMFVPT